MLRAWVLVMLLWAGPAGAQAIPVRSGEHAAFTRIVVPLPAPRAWSLVRTAEGYAFAVEGDQPRYDLTRVFRLIPRTRLTAIRADPGDGRLHLALRCTCHAVAEEVRPGTIAIDLYHGAPPQDSAWERTAEGIVAPPLGTAPQPAPVRPPPRPTPAPAPAARPPAYDFDWRHAAAPSHAAAVLPPSAEPPPAGPSPAAALLAEMARAGARGDIELALPETAPAAGPSAAEGHIRIGGAPFGPPAAGTGHDLTPDGRTCVPDTSLALADWGDPRPVAEALAPLTAGLVGEFDHPDPAALDRAQRYLLHLGFGAEARQLARLTRTALPDAGVRDSLARLLDGEPETARAFAGMAGCDGAAALWAMLSEPPGTKPATAAVLRSFSALPLHLRRQLAPVLAERFLDLGDPAPARAVRDAVLRAPGDPGDAVRLMERHIAHPGGPPAAALADLRAAPGETGLRATIDSLKAETAQGRPAAEALVTAAEALLMEHRGAAAEPAIRAALAGAHALRGDLARAFDLAAGQPEAGAQVWAILAANAPDRELLLRAIATPLPATGSAETDRRIARRLVGLGFPEAAIPWLAPARRGAAGPGPEDRLLEAGARLALGDARATLRLVAGDTGAAAGALRVAALAALDDPAALDLLEEGAARTFARRTGQWERVAATDAAPWLPAAAARTPGAATPDTPLARARALVEDSAAARQAVEALLAETRLPPQAAMP